MDTAVMDEIRAFVRKTQRAAIFFGVVTAAAIGFLVSLRAGYGFLAGVAVSVINFQLMAVDSYGMAGRSPKGARKYITGRVLIRYVIMFSFVALIVTRTEFNIVAAFTGLFFVQMILVGGRLLDNLRPVVKTSKG